jgi:hypothetical protein
MPSAKAGASEVVLAVLVVALDEELLVSHCWVSEVLGR